MMHVDEILGDDGRIAARLPKYEHRPQQIEMAEAVAQAIKNENHLVVEAGTGVGKSFGYLVPAILSLAENQETKDGGKRRIVVSTHTISLQEQLMSKDLPLLNSVIPLEFSAVLAKGRGNYISLRRMGNAIRNSESLFTLDDEIDQLAEIQRWSQKTTGGSRSEFDFRLLPQVWDEVQSDSSNCLGRKCPTYDKCHYFRARKRLQNADVLVVNHALFFSDLALRKLGVNILPDYDTVILDEAHTVLDVASSHLGMSVTMRGIEYTLGKLLHSKKAKGLLVANDFPQGKAAVNQCRAAAEQFFGDLQVWLAQRTDGSQASVNKRVVEPGIVANSLSPQLIKLSDMVRKFAEKLTNKSNAQDLFSACDRLDALATELENWRLQRLDDFVYWMETSTNRFGRPNVKLLASPLDIGPEMRERLFNEVKPAL